MRRLTTFLILLSSMTVILSSCKEAVTPAAPVVDSRIVGQWRRGTDFDLDVTADGHYVDTWRAGDIVTSVYEGTVEQISENRVRFHITTYTPENSPPAKMDYEVVYTITDTGGWQWDYGSWLYQKR